MKRIKLVYLITNCKIAGPINQTLNIIKNLDSNLYEIYLVTLFNEEINNSILNNYLSYCKKHYCLKLNKFTALLLGKYKLHQILKNLKPDLVHSVGMPAFRMSTHYKKTNHLVTLRNYPYDDYPSYYNKFIGTIMAFFDISLIKRRNKYKEFVTCSSSLSEIYLKKHNLSIPFIRNGVDNEKFKLKQKDTNPLRSKLNLPLDKIIFIYSAPFNDRKNHISLLEAFNKIHDNKCYLLLCGNGANYYTLKNKYSNNLNINFIGKVVNIEEYLQASDIYISTSKSEGLPNSVLEAMSTGLCVVLSNIPQHKEFFCVESNIGYIFDINNNDDLIVKIQKIISDNYFEKGLLCRKVIDNSLSSKKMCAYYDELYRSKIFKGDI